MIDACIGACDPALRWRNRDPDPRWRGAESGPRAASGGGLPVSVPYACDH